MPVVDGETSAQFGVALREPADMKHMHVFSLILHMCSRWSHSMELCVTIKKQHAAKGCPICTFDLLVRLMIAVLVHCHWPDWMQFGII